MSEKSLQNAEAALTQLTAFLSEPVTSDRDRAGVIQAFEFTFEATWKLFKHLAQLEGLEAESPRRAIMAAHKLGVITDEPLWLEMLRDRDPTTHIYDHQIAERIFTAIRTRYAEALTHAVARARTTLSNS